MTVETRRVVVTGVGGLVGAVLGIVAGLQVDPVWLACLIVAVVTFTVGTGLGFLGRWWVTR